MTFGKWLSARREAAHLTQQQLAERCGISAVYVSALERDEPNARDGSPRRPRPDKVERLAKALGVSVDEARLAAGYAALQDASSKLADELSRHVMASGFDELEDENLRQAFLEDMKSIADSMLKRKLEEQEKQRGS